jgi:hypothetical protein
MPKEELGEMAGMEQVQPQVLLPGRVELVMEGMEVTVPMYTFYVKVPLRTLVLLIQMEVERVQKARPDEKSGEMLLVTSVKPGCQEEQDERLQEL